VFEIEEIWKGQAKDQRLLVRTCSYYDPATGETITCGVNRFMVGSRYVVFAWRKGAILTASTECDLDIQLVDKAQETLKWLASKPSTRVRQTQ
jgi:hypothetical protein